MDASGSVHGAGGVGGVLGLFDIAAGALYVYGHDGNGNVSELFDSTGAVVAHYEYDPFGGATVSSGSLAGANPFRFSGKYLDADGGLNLYYYGHRYLCPALGRWLSRDPIAEEGGLLLYGFVGNDPANMIDPLGLAVEIIAPTEDLRDTNVSSQLRFWRNVRTRFSQERRNKEQRLHSAERKLARVIRELPRKRKAADRREAEQEKAALEVQIESLTREVGFLTINIHKVDYRENGRARFLECLSGLQNIHALVFVGHGEAGWQQIGRAAGSHLPF